MEPTPKPSQEPNRIPITLAPMPTTHQKSRPKTKEVSSRYLSTPSTVIRSHSPFHPPSSSSTNASHFATNPPSDRFADENAIFGQPDTLSRRKMKLFSDNNAVPAQTPIRSIDRKMEVLGIFRENPLRTKDDMSLTPTTRLVDWGRGRKEDSFCRSSTRLDSQRHSFEANKEGGRPFPPQPPKASRPPNGKLGAEMRKERKGSKREEEVHSLRMLECRYLQWGFVNARARVVNGTRRIAAEKSVYNASCKLWELQESVVTRRIELEQLRRTESLSSIVDAQMPYLNAWTGLEKEYMSYLSGATNALQNASSQIPITGSVRADISELKEVIDSTVNILNGISPCVDIFLRKAQELESITSKLAKVVSIEKAMIEECGNLLSMAHDLQVTESSLRSRLIQAKHKRTK